MPDSADELIVKLQHLQAQARASLDARALASGLERLTSAAQRLAWNCQRDIATFEKVEVDGEARLETLRVDGVTSDEAPEYVAVKRAVDEAKRQLVRSRAQLNFALDRLSEAERREYEAFHAEVRAQTHGQLADERSGDPPVEP